MVGRAHELSLCSSYGDPQLFSPCKVSARGNSAGGVQAKQGPPTNQSTDDLLVAYGSVCEGTQTGRVNNPSGRKQSKQESSQKRLRQGGRGELSYREGEEMYRSTQLSQRSTANTSLIYFLSEYKKFNQLSGKKLLGSKGRGEGSASKKSVEVTQANTTLFNLRM